MFKKIKSALAALATVAFTVNGFAGTALAAETNEVQTGTYTGVYTKVSQMAGEVEYTYSMTLSKDGNYAYDVSFPMGEEVYSNEEAGTYVVDGESITFTPSAETKFKNDEDTYTGTVKEGIMETVTKCVSNFASTPTELTFTLSEDENVEDDVTPDEETNTPENLDTLESGSYAVDISWFEMMDKSADPILILDAENDTFRVYDALKESDRGNGTVSFAAETGVYTLTYTDEKNAGNQTTFTYDAEKDVVTFTSPLYANGVMYNSGAVAEDGAFFVYTATLVVEEDAVADTLESGIYAVDLTWIPFMDNMLDPIVEIDAENKTFDVYTAKAPETSKGNGTVTFDETTGEYTLNYAAGGTTIFTYDAETDTMTFTSALLYGKSSFNNTDEAGNFVSYTAVATTLSTPDAGEGTTTPDVDDETTSEDNVDKAPQTGDTANAGFMSVVCMAAAAVAVTLIRKRNLA